MRILFIAPLPPPVTGHSIVSKVLYDDLTNEFDVDIANLSKDVFRPGVTSLKRFADVFKILLFILRKNSNSDLIYLTISESLSGNLKDLLIYSICFRRLSSTFIHVHGGSIKKLLWDRRRILLHLNRFFVKRMGGVIITGPAHLESFESMIPRERIHIVPNFAQDYLFITEKDIRDKFAGDRPLTILYLSNFIPRKGYQDLLEGFLALSNETRRKIRVEFAGAFESKAEEDAFLKRINGIEGIRFHGFVDGDKKKALLSRAHVFCLPTAFLEGQPLSILEAYAAGCVVITTAQKGILDIFEPEINGFEILPKSPESIKTVIENVLTLDEMLLRIALSNRALAEEKYRIGRFTDSIKKIFLHRFQGRKERINGEKAGTNCAVPVTSDVSGKPLCAADSENERRGVQDVRARGARGARPLTQNQAYQICSNCIMDTSDPNITFDDKGWCDYCRNFERNIKPHWHPDEIGAKILARQTQRIKREGKGRDHDCLIGISGGIDSSYVTYLAKEKLGLRPLIYHVDAGWNSQEAVNNIERLIDGLGLDLRTEVVDWLEMKDLQLAFLKAQVPHQDTPQDHAFFAALYNFAAKTGFKYVITGANYSTECVREPLAWHYHASDLRQLKDIHRRFGQRPLKTYPTADIFKYKIYYRYLKGVRVIKPLNDVPYIKENAMKELIARFGWQKYPHKHYESRFTRFFEGYWLLRKFGFDKRRAHFSSVILTGQMTREEALARIALPPYDAKTMAEDFEYVAKKLDLSVADLRRLMDGQNKTYRDYKSRMPLIGLGTNLLRAFGFQKVIIR